LQANATDLATPGFVFIMDLSKTLLRLLERVIFTGTNYDDYQ
jgi:hypothetical protein